MGITVTEEITIDSQWSNGEQGEYPDEGMPISLPMVWEDDIEVGEDFTKQDFEKALKKVSRKVKK